MSLEDSVARFLRHLKVEARLSPHTLSAYARDLSDLVDRVSLHQLQDWNALTQSHVRACVAQRRRQGLSARSMQRYLSAIRSFLSFLEAEEEIGLNVAAQVKGPKAPRKLPATLDPDEVNRLLDIPADLPIERRDKAILELFYSSGLRLSELTQLNWQAIDGASVRVLGKAQKARLVPIGRQARKALKNWRHVWPEWAQAGEEAVFLSRRGTRLSNRAVQQRIRHWAEQQGLWKKVHPHLLRHCFASHLLESSGELRAVQELLGHQDISTTQVYTHLDYQHLAQVYDQTHPRARRK